MGTACRGDRASNDMNRIPTPISYLFHILHLFLHKKSCIETLSIRVDDIDGRNCIIIVQMDVGAPKIVGLLLDLK